MATKKEEKKEATTPHLYEIAEARLTPYASVSDNPAVKALREQTELLAQENTILCRM